MLIRPKFVAARDFRFRGRRYCAGDPITDPVVLDGVRRHGDQFVTDTSRRAAPAPNLPDQTGDAGDDTEGDQS